MSPPVHLVRGDDPSLVRDAVSRLVDELVGDGDRTLMVDEHAGDEYEIAALADAAQTPPFLTERRVVVGPRAAPVQGRRAGAARRLPGRPAADDRRSCWCGSPAPCRRGCSTPSRRPAASTSTPARAATPRTSGRGSPSASPSPGVHLDVAAVDAVAETLGEDVSRLCRAPRHARGHLRAGRQARRRRRRALPRRGRRRRAVGAHRRHRPGRHPHAPSTACTACIGGGERHALVVLATLHTHVQRMLALDGAEVRTEKEAAAVLGMKGSTFPAKKALDQGAPARLRQGGAGDEAAGAGRRRPPGRQGRGPTSSCSRCWSPAWRLVWRRR